MENPQVNDVSTDAMPVNNEAVSENETPLQPENQENLEQTPPQDESENKLSEWDNRFDKLSKREFALTTRESKLKESQALLTQYQELQNLAKENPMQALDSLGIEWSSLVDAQLNSWESEQKDPMQKSIEETQNQVKKLQEELQNKEKLELETKQTQAKNNVVNALFNEFSTKKDTYQYLACIEEGELKPLLFQTAQEVYEQTGKVPQAEEVCNLLNGIYQEQISKFSSVGANKVPEETKASEDDFMPGLTTTTHNTSAHTTPTNVDTAQLSFEDRKKRALKALSALS